MANEQRLTTFPFDMLDAPVAGGHFLGDYVGLVASGRKVYPVFGIATRDDVTNLYTRPIAFGSRSLARAP